MISQLGLDFFSQIDAMKFIYQVLSSCLLLQVYTLANPNGRTSNSFVMRVGFDPAAIETIGGKEYYFNPQAIGDSAFRAQAYCNDVGMQLLSIETMEESDLLSNHILNNLDPNKPFWTSGEKWQSAWRWTGSGRLFTFTRWAAEEPNYTGTDDVCVFFTASEGWYDGGCADQHNFICEYYDV